MGHSLYGVYLHIAFSTKYRQPFLDKQIQRELYPYLAASIRNQGAKCLIVGGEVDHVHLLIMKGAIPSSPNLVKEIKRTSSMWIKTKGPAYRGFYWQNGSGVFSVHPTEA